MRYHVEVLGACVFKSDSRTLACARAHGEKDQHPDVEVNVYDGVNDCYIDWEAE